MHLEEERDSIGIHLKKKKPRENGNNYFVLTVLLFSNSIIHMIVLCIQHGHVLPCQTNPVVVVVVVYIFGVSRNNLFVYIVYK